MQRLNDIMKKWFYRTILCFTLVVTGFAIVGLSYGAMNTMFCSQILYLLLFSALIGVSFGVADGIKTNAVLKASVQFVCSYLSFVLCFYVLEASKNFAYSNNKILGMIATTLLFVGIYVVVFAVVFAFKKVLTARKTAKLEYQNQFDIKE